LSAQGQPAARKQAAAGPKVVRISIHPAAPGRPALKYHLLPELHELEPGNAATTYYLATLANSGLADSNTVFARFDEWSEMPLDKLPREEVRAALDLVKSALHFAHVGARRDHCAWGLTLKADGFASLLPHLNPLRGVANCLVVQGRLQIAEHNYDGAIDTMQTSMAMAHHLNEEACVIQNLVGVGITYVTLEHVALQFIQAPDSPNLYWGLANLPRPFHDSPNVIQYERSFLGDSFPAFRNLDNGRLTVAEWNEFMEKFPLIMGGQGGGKGFDKLGMTALMIQMYPEAKKYLLGKGLTPEKVEAMPVHQALARYLIDGYREQSEELYKWYGLPYWQAREGMDRASVELEKQTRNSSDFSLTKFLVPALGRARSRAVQGDQMIAIFQCIEAMRAYAAGHDGKLPASLDAMTETPAPLDPFTNRPFSYELAGDTAIIDVPLPANLPRRYEITIGK
jgi:hypothetical protein